MAARRTLVIGGTRNLGPALVEALLARGDEVTILHRGQTQADLPPAIERLHADRSDADQLARAIDGRSWDCVVDMTLYTGADAKSAARIFSGRCERYIMISTGQVYLVRQPELPRPFREEDYEGEVMPEPQPAGGYDYKNWLYGFEKRNAEDALLAAHGETGFPFVAIRLPMVNSERDHYDRIYGYLTRLWDGGPTLAPAGPIHLLRHVYGGDVIRAILAASLAAKPGAAYNISQEERIAFDDFMNMLADLTGTSLQIVRVPRAELEAQQFFPACSPFTERWMSDLDPRRSKTELGVTYTPLPMYLSKLVKHFSEQPRRTPIGYEHRAEELALASKFGGC
jgi:nucleoside-diphosphate-sugar epimerase